MTPPTSTKPKKRKSDPSKWKKNVIRIAKAQGKIVFF